jgi:hypothetical protein
MIKRELFTCEAVENVGQRVVLINARISQSKNIKCNLRYVQLFIVHVHFCLCWINYVVVSRHVCLSFTSELM